MSKRTNPIQLKKYIGVPYEERNCFELVQVFYKENFDIEIKNYFEGPVPSREECQTLIVSNKGDFIEVKEPEFGDIVVIKFYGIECHLGIVVTKDQFLHTAKDIGCNIDRIDRYKHMISGFYRHRYLP